MDFIPQRDLEVMPVAPKTAYFGDSSYAKSIVRKYLMENY